MPILLEIIKLAEAPFQELHSVDILEEKHEDSSNVCMELIKLAEAPFQELHSVDILEEKHEDSSNVCMPAIPKVRNQGLYVAENSKPKSKHKQPIGGVSKLFREQISDSLPIFNFILPYMNELPDYLVPILLEIIKLTEAPFQELHSFDILEEKHEDSSNVCMPAIPKVRNRGLIVCCRK